MKLKKIKRENGTCRLCSVPQGASLTDQSDKNMSDINVIMKNYAKTGLLPQFKEKVEQYLDVTELPSYMDAHARISEAKRLFSELPAQVRNAMLNDPANLEPFIADPRNMEFLIEHGVLERVDEPKSKQVSSSSQSETSNPPSVD